MFPQKPFIQKYQTERKKHMAVYDAKSLKADEFINDGEILETIKYAE